MSIFVLADGRKVQITSSDAPHLTEQERASELAKVEARLAWLKAERVRIEEEFNLKVELIRDRIGGDE